MKAIQFFFHHKPGTFRYPQEDALRADVKNGVFAVADGVHMYSGLEYKGKRPAPSPEGYPNPSPAGILARQFCLAFCRYAKKGEIRNAFIRANATLATLNRKRSNFPLKKANLLVAATAAFGRIKRNVLEWGLICDSGVAVIGKRGELKLFELDHTWFSDLDFSPFDLFAKVFFIRTVFRNALSDKGKRLGYGVLTGEKCAEAYVRFGKRKLQRGDVVVFLTDGFEKFIPDKGFRKALASFDQGKIGRVIKALERRGEGFQKEKTLIVVKPD